MNGTDSKNGSDQRQLLRFWKEANFDMTWERFLELDKLDKAKPLIVALKQAKKVGGGSYPNHWFPNFLNTIQRIVRARDRKFWHLKLVNRECTEAEVPSQMDWKNDLILQPVLDQCNECMRASHAAGISKKSKKYDRVLSKDCHHITKKLAGSDDLHSCVIDQLSGLILMMLLLFLWMIRFAKRGGKELASATWGECEEGEDEEGLFFQYKPTKGKTDQGDLKTWRKVVQPKKVHDIPALPDCVNLYRVFKCVQKKSVGSDNPDQRIFTSVIPKKYRDDFPGKEFSENGTGHATLAKTLQWCLDFAGIKKTVKNQLARHFSITGWKNAGFTKEQICHETDHSVTSKTIESAYYDGDEAAVSKEKTIAVFGPIATGMNFSKFNQKRKMQKQIQALGFPWHSGPGVPSGLPPSTFAQRFSPYPALPPPPVDEIARLKEQLHEAQMREKDTKIEFLQYQVQQQAMLNTQCIESMRFLDNDRGKKSSETKTITFTQTQTRNVLKN